MLESTEHAAPTTPASVDRGALLEEAGAAVRTRPQAERRTELDHQLRAEIRRLIPRVQEQADALNRGTRAWYGRDRVLADARQQLAEGLSPSTLSACLRLDDLARVARTLNEYAGGDA